MAECRPAGVDVARVEGAASFAGSMVCGLRTCPVCGPRIAGAHRDDIREVVRRASESGYVVKFLTLTLRHRWSNSLEDTLEAILACWRGLTHGRWWDEWKRDAGLVGMVRVIECTWGCANGWHPHAHVLLFLRPSTPLRGCTGDDVRPRTHPLAPPAPPHEAPGSLGSALFARWLTLVEAAGYRSLGRHQVLRDVVTEQHLDVMAGYATKEWDIASEMASGAVKGSPGRWTPAGLLAQAASGDQLGALLFREYELATSGRRLYASASAQLRARLAVLVAPEESEAAEQPAAPAGRDRLVTIARDEWRDLRRRPGMLADLAAVVDDGADGWDVVWWLRDRGITARAFEEQDDPSAWASPPGGAPEAPAGSPAWLAVV